MQARGFRNLAPEPLDVDAPLVVWWGDNGQGKTNWLEAVGVLGTLKSFRTARLAEVVTLGETTSTVEAVAESEGLVRRFRFQQGPGGRSLRREDRAVDSATWLGSLRASHFAPEDVAVVRGEPALRRALLDRSVLAARPAYLGLARDYRRVVEQKAALLRSGRAEEAQLDALDTQLVALGARVVRERADTVRRLREPFTRWYAQFAAGEAADVAYRPWVGDDGELEARITLRLRELRPSEREGRRVLGGPHRDDLLFRVGGRPARATASQGQVRSIVLAWKLAEVEGASVAGEAPLFLIDDLGSELDRHRTRAFVGLLRQLGAQVFVTTTDRAFVPPSAEPTRVWRVVGGRCEEG